jgi:hypothetical protein
MTTSYRLVITLVQSFDVVHDRIEIDADVGAQEVRIPSS